MSNDRYISVFMTAPSPDEAELIAKTLVNEKIAACVHLVPIRSLYNWENQLCDDSEIFLIAKTKYSVFHSRLIPAVKKLHSYEVSEITALPIIDGESSYLAWIDEEVDEMLDS